MMDKKQYNQVELHRKKTKVSPDPSLKAKGSKEAEYPSVGLIVVPSKDYRITERKLI